LLLASEREASLGTYASMTVSQRKQPLYHRSLLLLVIGLFYIHFHDGQSMGAAVAEISLRRSTDMSWTEEVEGEAREGETQRIN
jgi:hypothetical protein